MISVAASIVESMVAQARDAAPVEACGLLAGVESDVRKAYPMTNVDQSAEHFSLDPAEHFAVVKDARALGLQIIAAYHSHAATPARMSEEDLRLALTPGVYYVIVSLADPCRPEVKAFSVADGRAAEERVQVE